MMETQNQLIIQFGYAFKKFWADLQSGNLTTLIYITFKNKLI